MIEEAGLTPMHHIPLGTAGAKEQEMEGRASPQPGHAQWEQYCAVLLQGVRLLFGMCHGTRG